jgi:hypothetical protein
MPTLLRKRPTVNVQRFIQGNDATSSVACWQGEVLASANFEVLAKGRTTGPSSVIRLIHNREMSRASQEMVGLLGLSGLYGFDFVLEAKTGRAYLIEVNPRATQTCHLALGAGHDLPAALTAALIGRPIEERVITTANETIALFPQEWGRDPESEFLSQAYHDVPWTEPKLIKACIEGTKRPGRWRFRESPFEALAKLEQQMESKETVSSKRN